WTAANDLAREGRWVWNDDDKQVLTSYWHHGEPNNYGNEDCAVLHNGKLYDFPCSHHLGYICE
ncbi:hypothetical protein CAPTEDRAFT_57106, partial [Capitella teleta]